MHQENKTIEKRPSKHISHFKNEFCVSSVPPKYVENICRK